MHDSYRDIYERIAEPPTWYDRNGCPRWGTPAPRLHKFMGRIRCQHCHREFLVCMADAVYTIDLDAMVGRAASEKEGFKGPLTDGNITQVPWSGEGDLLNRYALDADWHYGDPPNHGCAGDSMNSIPEYEWDDEWEEVKDA